MKPEQAAGQIPAASPKKERCSDCGGISGHDPRLCVFYLKRKLEDSERERKIAEGTVSWLRKRLGEPDED